MDLSTIVYIVVGLIIAVIVLGLLWWLIGYAEKTFTGIPPIAFKVVRFVFVALVVLFLIGLLLNLLGVPVVRLR